MFAILGNRRKKGPKFFFPPDASLHSEKFVSRFFRSYRNDFSTLTIIIKKTCRPLFVISRGFSHSKTWEKKAKTLCHLEITFFFEKFGSGLLGSKRNHLLACKLPVKLPFMPLQFVSWPLSSSIIQEKRAQKVFFSLETLPFFAKDCTFNNLLCVTEVTL